MDYKEKYKQLAKFIKDLYPHMSDYCKEKTEGMIPELKENEDELMKKEAISIIKQYSIICERECDKCYTADRVIAWIEKQGNQKLTLEDAAKAFLEALSDTPYNNTPITEAQVVTKQLLVFLSDLKSYNPNAINEQSFTDKVKPKFNVGDWITDGKSNFQIVRIEDDCYVADDGDKVWIHGIYQYYHLWTIQDAKDGDILTDGKPFIFKSLDVNKHSYAYCGLNTYNDFIIESEGEHGEWTWAQDIKPSTKEQRDILFQKMEEAGYIWDAEKKKLKKINLNKAEHGKYYYCIKDYFCGGKKQSSKGDIVQALRGLPIMGLEDISEYFIPVNNIHNHAWSEEDEKERKRVVGLLEGWLYTFKETCYAEDCKCGISWLKSLKQRLKV